MAGVSFRLQFFHIYTKVQSFLRRRLDIHMGGLIIGGGRGNNFKNPFPPEDLQFL